MKFKLLALSCVIMLSMAFSACVGSDSSSMSTASVSTTAVATTTSGTSEESIQYNGEFNESVFKQLCNDVVIGNKRASLPFSLGELGEEFSYDDSPIFDEENQIASAGWTYNNNIIGFFSAECQDADDDLNDNKIYSIYFLELVSPIIDFSTDQ